MEYNLNLRIIAVWRSGLTHKIFILAYAGSNPVTVTKNNDYLRLIVLNAIWRSKWQFGEAVSYKVHTLMSQVRLLELQYFFGKGTQFPNQNRIKGVAYMSKIDVIIPCYKSKETISKTLHSIAMQSISDDISVYLINDCDGMHYDDIMYEFAHLDIVYIEREYNGGCSAARNTGIKNAKSDYIIFIDSDDCFSNCLALEIMYNRILAEKTDMVISVFESEMRCQNGVAVKKMERAQTWMHGKLLRRQFIIDNDLYFNEELRLNEDMLFNQLFIDLGAKVTEIPMVTSMWRDNQNSLTHKSLYENKKTFIQASLAYLKECEARHIDKEKIVLRVLQNLTMVYQYYNIVLDDCPENKDDFLFWCRMYWIKCEKYVENVEDDYIRTVFRAVMKEYNDIPNITFVQFLDEIKK